MIAAKLASANEVDNRVGIFFDVPKKPFDYVSPQKTAMLIGFNTGVDFSIEATAYS